MTNPGVLLVRIKMLDPTFDSSGGWATSLKLHFDDLLSLGPSEVNAASQSLNLLEPAALDAEEAKEPEKRAEEGRFRYFNIIELGEAYVGLSRAKVLGEKSSNEKSGHGHGEEGEEMIWHVCDARFAAYELFKQGGEMLIGGKGGKAWTFGCASEGGKDDVAAGAEEDSTTTIIMAEIFAPLSDKDVERKFIKYSLLGPSADTSKITMARLFKLRNDKLNPVPVLESAVDGDVDC